MQPNWFRSLTISAKNPHEYRGPLRHNAGEVYRSWLDQNFGDLYALEQHRDDIIQTEGFGVKSYERLQESIEKSRHCTLAKFIAGLGIPMVGRHAGRDLDRYFGGSWEAFESAIQSGFDFTQLPNFGETMHNNIYNGMRMRKKQSFGVRCSTNHL